MEGNPELIMKVRSAVGTLAPHFGLSYREILEKEDNLTVVSDVREIPFFIEPSYRVRDACYFIPPVTKDIGDFISLEEMNAFLYSLTENKERFIVLEPQATEISVGHETTHWLHEQFSGSDIFPGARRPNHGAIQSNPFGARPAEVLVEGLAMIGGYITKTGRVPFNVKEGLPLLKNYLDLIVLKLRNIKDN